jgi:glyoxylase-like metal-dependent hydrolase (beta-lactamase superfamily II)
MKRVLTVYGALALCLGMSVWVVATQQDVSKAEVKATKLSGNVYMLTGAGGNIGASVGPDGIMIVDDQFAPLAEKIRAVLKTLGTGPLKFVVNTHWHGDHTGGNAKFGTEATIVAHDNVRRRLSSEQKIFGRPVPASPREALPVVTYAQSVSLHFNGEEIRIRHFPHGHTDGDSVIYFTSANVVHMGDHFFAGKFPFVDLENGGNVVGLTNNVAEIMKDLPTGVKLIPGHGPLATIDDLKLYHRMLVETTDIVRKQKQAGKTLEQIKAQGLPAEWNSWGTDFIKTPQWIELIYKSL